MTPSDVSNADAPGAPSTHGSESSPAWARCLDGDREAFHDLVTPHLDELFAAGQRDIRYHVAVGDLREGDLSGEELVGRDPAASLARSPNPGRSSSAFARGYWDCSFAC